MAKKRKLSGLSGLELTLAYHSLMKLQISISEELEDEDGEDDIALAQKNNLFDHHLAGMINLMQSRLEGPQVRYGGHQCILFIPFAAVLYFFRHDRGYPDRQAEHPLCWPSPAETLIR